MSVILMSTLFYKALILQGEIWCWSVLGLKGLNSTDRVQIFTMHFLTEYENSVLSKKKSIVLEASKQKIKDSNQEEVRMVSWFKLFPWHLFRDVISMGKAQALGVGDGDQGSQKK